MSIFFQVKLIRRGWKRAEEADDQRGNTNMVEDWDK